MSHRIKCTLMVYDNNASDLLNQFDEMIRRICPVASDAPVPNVTVDGLTTVGREYIVEVESEEECHRICCTLPRNCPAPFEVMMHRSHWSVEELGH